LLLLVGVLIASASLVCAATAARDSGRTYLATCADSVYQTPASAPPKTFAALRLGPAVFNHLGTHEPRVLTPPSRKDPFYNVPSFFNILTTARRGVTIRLIGGANSDRLSAGRVGQALAARAIRFSLCRDTTARPLITQYGISFLVRSPGCFTFEVQPVGSPRRYRATIRVRVPHC
jgi:hypothetical protein